MIEHQTVVVRRSEGLGGPGGHTAAVLTATVDDDFFERHKDYEVVRHVDDPSGGRSFIMLGAIVAAVTKWISSTKRGRYVYFKSNNEDFNVGDLALELDAGFFETASGSRESVEHYLAMAGFQDLKVDAFHDDSLHPVEYDDKLVNEPELAYGAGGKG